MEFTITNGTIVDGTGRPGFRADLAIDGGTVAAIGHDLPRGGRVIDAEGQVVCPGFIDIHSHSSLIWLSDPKVLPKIHQGVTTEVCGMDGYSAAPIRPTDVPAWRRMLEGLEGDPIDSWPWQSFGEYRQLLKGTSVNWAPMVGHGNLRLATMGTANRRPSSRELAEMCNLLDVSFQEGASALSSGLIYPPQSYSNEEELVALGKVAARYGKPFSFHLRSQAGYMRDALNEVLSVGRRSGCAIQITHFQISDRRMWDQLEPMVQLIESARREGVDVACDQYAYTAGSTVLSSCLPPYAQEDGAAGLRSLMQNASHRLQLKRDTLEGIDGWDSRFLTSGPENVYISYVKSDGNQGMVGKSLNQIAETTGQTPFDAMVRLLIEEDFAVSMIAFSQSEEVVEAIMRLPWQMYCSDSLMVGKPHPRAYGNYPRILGRFVREKGTLPLEEAIKKATSLPAARLGIKDRGALSTGMAADLVILDPKSVIDRATYEEPEQYPVGINHVFVNGKQVIAEGQHTGELPGYALTV